MSPQPPARRDGGAVSIVIHPTSTTGETSVRVGGGLVSENTSHGLVSCPAAPVTIAVYLAALADAGVAVSTIERTLAGIAHEHRSRNHVWQRGEPAIRETMAGIRRKLGTSPASKKAPVGNSELAALVATLGEGLTGLRDRALLTLEWSSACRRSELVALDVTDVEEQREGLLVRHLHRIRCGRSCARRRPSVEVSAPSSRANSGSSARRCRGSRLKELEASPQDVVMLRVYVVNATSEAFGQAVTPLRELLGDAMPSITTIGVQALYNPEIKVEIEMVVRLP